MARALTSLRRRRTTRPSHSSTSPTASTCARDRRWVLRSVDRRRVLRGVLLGAASRCEGVLGVLDRRTQAPHRHPEGWPWASPLQTCTVQAHALQAPHAGQRWYVSYVLQCCWVRHCFTSGAFWSRACRMGQPMEGSSRRMARQQCPATGTRQSSSAAAARGRGVEPCIAQTRGPANSEGRPAVGRAQPRPPRIEWCAWGQGGRGPGIAAAWGWPGGPVTVQEHPSWAAPTPRIHHHHHLYHAHTHTPALPPPTTTEPTPRPTLPAGRTWRRCPRRPTWTPMPPCPWSSLAWRCCGEGGVLGLQGRAG